MLESLVGLEELPSVELLEPAARLRRKGLLASPGQGGRVRSSRPGAQDVRQGGVELTAGEHKIRARRPGAFQGLMLDVGTKGRDRNAPSGGRGLQHLDPALPGDSRVGEVKEDQRRALFDDPANELALGALEGLSEGHAAGRRLAVDAQVLRAPCDSGAASQFANGVFQARDKKEVVRQREDKEVPCRFVHLPNLSARRMRTSRIPS